MCSSQRANRPAEANEFILDTADGLDWQTLCKCDVIYAVPREELNVRRGKVSPNRRAQLIRKVIEAHGWPAVLVA